MVKELPMLKACAVLHDRTTSFFDEGYMLMHEYNTPSLYVARLRHHYNGNEVTITGFPTENWFQQKINGRVVINHQQICAHDTMHQS